MLLINVDRHDLGLFLDQGSDILINVNLLRLFHLLGLNLQLLQLGVQVFLSLAPSLLDLLLLHSQHLEIKVLTTLLVMQVFEIMHIVGHVVLFDPLLIILEVDLVLFYVFERIVDVSSFVDGLPLGLLLLIDHKILIHLSLR